MCGKYFKIGVKLMAIINKRENGAFFIYEYFPYEYFPEEELDYGSMILEEKL